MSAKITADASGTKVTIGTAAEDALQIDSAAKTIKAVSPYSLSVSTISYASDAAAQAAGVPVGGLYNSSGTVKVRVA